MRERDARNASSSSSVSKPNGGGGSGEKDRRGVSLQSKSVDTVLRDVIIPIADRIKALPSYTSFVFTEQDSLETALRDVVRRDCPTLFSSKATLLEAVGVAYDRVQASL